VQLRFTAKWQPRECLEPIVSIPEKSHFLPRLDCGLRLQYHGAIEKVEWGKHAKAFDERHSIVQHGYSRAGAKHCC
jgi:hypothetical protein